MVELAIGERQPLGLAFEQRDPRCELRRARQARPRRREHLGALVEADHLDVVATHERAGDKTGAGRHVEHPLARARLHRRNHRGAPPRILAKAEHGAGAVVVAGQAGEQRQRVLFACARSDCAAGVWSVLLGGAGAGRAPIMPGGRRRGHAGLRLGCRPTASTDVVE